MRPTRTSGRLGGQRIEGAKGVVERIALDGDASCASNEREQIVQSESLRRVRTRLVIDLLADHGSLEIVHAPRQRDLRQERRDHDPVRLHMVEVVEKETPDSDVAQIVEAGGRGALPAERDTELVVVRVIRERDVREKAARLILQI